ncbi:MAG: hypothetical protein LIP08_03115 [Bacteroides sp.]|nr:hypothetical protein [Bacteroides sp.]
MSFSLIQRKFLIALTGLTLLTGWLGAGILIYIFPGHYFPDYLLIPVYFFVFSFFYISMLERCQHFQPQKLLLLYLVMKVVKIVITLMVWLIYCYFFRTYAREFLLTFIVFYLIFLVFESRFFLAFEKDKKKQDAKHEKQE